MELYLKASLITLLIFSSSISIAYVIDENLIMIPQQTFEHTLTDEQNDVNFTYIDIIEYGSYLEDKDTLCVYLKVAGILNESIIYNLVIVGKTSDEFEGHIYHYMIRFIDGIFQEDQYNYPVTLKNQNQINLFFPLDRLIPNDCIIGIEASIRSPDANSEDDFTTNARNNPLKTSFLGIF